MASDKRRKGRKKTRKKKTRKLRSRVLNGTVHGTKKNGKQGDPLDFQISARVRIPKGRTIAAQVLTEAIKYRIRKGRSPKGIRLRIIQWRNPDRKFARNDWRKPTDPDVMANSKRMGYGPPMSPQQAAWVTLRQALENVSVSNIQVRNR